VKEAYNKILGDNMGEIEGCTKNFGKSKLYPHLICMLGK